MLLLNGDRGSRPVLRRMLWSPGVVCLIRNRASGYWFDAVGCNGELLPEGSSLGLIHNLPSLDSLEKGVLSLGNRPLVWRDLSRTICNNDSKI